MQNKKIQLCALSMAGYNCTVEYIAGTENTCTDLLSRLPDGGHAEAVAEPFEVDINDNTFEVDVINSNEIDPKQFASYEVAGNPEKEAQIWDLTDVDMTVEQAKDEEIVAIKICLGTGAPSPAIKCRYIIENDVVYYMSHPDDNPTLRLYVTNHLHEAVVKQYHDDNGHMGVQKILIGISLKYYWPNLSQELYNYVSSCVTCQTKSALKTKPPIQETDIPPYHFAKVSLD